MKNRCEGWRRHGGVFTLGPVEWKQCENEGVVLLTIMEMNLETKGKLPEQRKLPACMECWKEARESGTMILEVEPIPEAWAPDKKSSQGA